MPTSQIIAVSAPFRGVASTVVSFSGMPVPQKSSLSLHGILARLVSDVKLAPARNPSLRPRECTQPRCLRTAQLLDGYPGVEVGDRPPDTALYQIRWRLRGETCNFTPSIVLPARQAAK